MNIKLAFHVALALGIGAAALDASAQTLYKLIDKNGKVTYSEKPPKDFDGKVIRLDIDPNANTATLPKPAPPPAPAAGGSAGNSDAPVSKTQPKSSGDKVQDARDRLDAAKKALENARNNPGESDLSFIGNKGGGTRPVPSDAYTAKLAALEAAVKAAEEELKRAEGG
jgi:hypothetical protein